ncbi:MAG: glycosyltransferase [Sphingobacteriales bacterium]|nr:glycosyltransferase [Sphingobacteriales bacterium]
MALNNNRILIAPLDWGLGHATRCVPIIKQLLLQNCAIFIGAEGSTAKLLKSEFPSITILPLKGYKIEYSKKRFTFLLKIIAQLPRILKVIYYEKRWVEEAIKTHNINGVISDNRLGFCSNKIPSVYITHQLLIKTGLKLFDKIAQKIHYHYINKFSVCWVPDFERELTLAGDLSHPKKLPNVPVQYLGALSRFKRLELDLEYKLCIIISGPEPQRAVFEKIILSQLHLCKEKIVMVRGLPNEEKELNHSFENLTIYNHLDAEKLNTIIEQSEMVLSRSGYSTIMDLITLNKNAILVPTPAQPEQEYLAIHLNNNGLFQFVQQSDLKLSEFLKCSKENNQTSKTQPENSQKIIKDWLNQL